VVRATIGGAVGVGAAYVLVAIMRARLGGSVARMADASIDGRVLALAVIVTLACGIACGLIPALRIGRSDVVGDLRDGGRGVMGSVSRDRLRRTLVVVEVALSFMLLATAGLLTRSVASLLAVPKGFDSSNLVAGFTWLPSTRYKDSVAQKLFFDRWSDALSTKFGPAHVTLVSDLPIAGGTDGGVNVEGRAEADAIPNVEKRIVGTNYFGVLGAHLVAGRFLTTADVLGAPPVIVVNETLARQGFKNESAVGRRMSFGWGIDGYQTIVGVVSDLREGSLNGPDGPAIYISAEQRPNSSMRALVRTVAPLAEVAAAMRRTLRDIDPAIPLVSTETMADVVRMNTSQQRASATMLAAFAIMALTLTAVGLYGVISYSVAQRTQELGIRAALGALPRDLMRLVLRHAAALAATGILLGLAGALAARRLIASQLFGVGPSDPMTLVGATVLLLIVALVASMVPTRRAARADPLEALRAD
jgi:putative ABC transport system permease protein